MTPTDETNRLDNTTTCLPLAYGSIAFNLGPQADEYRTHKWTLYLRSPDKSFDLGVAISKVVFQLHPSFAQATREVTEPPFEVTECGWGEFEASLRIVWKEVAEERSTVLTHVIKLYPSAPTAPTADPSSHNLVNTNEPVVSEKYDEVVFTNPKLEFHKMLQSGNKRPLSYPLSNQPAVIEYFRTYDDNVDVQKMLAAKKFLEGELRNVKDRLLKADHELDELKTSLTLLKGNPSVMGDGGGGDPSGKTGGGGAPSGKVAGVEGGAKLKTKSKSRPAVMEQGAAKKAKTS